MSWLENYAIRGSSARYRRGSGFGAVPDLPDDARRGVRAGALLCRMRHAEPRRGERSGPGSGSDENPMNSETRLVQVRQHVLKQNDVAARALRQRFREAGVYVVSLVSSPGTGKTTFLEKVLGLLRTRHRVAALVGDLATDNDAVR